MGSNVAKMSSEIDKLVSIVQNQHQKLQHLARTMRDRQGVFKQRFCCHHYHPAHLMIFPPVLHRQHAPPQHQPTCHDHSRSATSFGIHHKNQQKPLRWTIFASRPIEQPTEQTATAQREPNPTTSFGKSICWSEQEQCVSWKGLDRNRPAANYYIQTHQKDFHSRSQQITNKNKCLINRMDLPPWVVASNNSKFKRSRNATAMIVIEKEVRIWDKENSTTIEAMGSKLPKLLVEDRVPRKTSNFVLCRNWLRRWVPKMET